MPLESLRGHVIRNTARQIGEFVIEFDFGAVFLGEGFAHTGYS